MSNPSETVANDRKNPPVLPEIVNREHNGKDYYQPSPYEMQETAHGITMLVKIELIEFLVSLYSFTHARNFYLIRRIFLTIWTGLPRCSPS